MPKKSTLNLSSLISQTIKQETRGRKKTAHKVITNTSQDGTKPGETRATFIVNQITLNKIKAIASRQKIQIKDIVDSALSRYLTAYEKKNGPVKFLKR